MSQGIAHWCGPRPDDPKPIVYLSGGMRIPAFVKSKYPYLCCSHMYDKGGLSSFHEQNPSTRILYDSGAYSFQQAITKGKVLDEEAHLKDYVGWIKDHCHSSGVYNIDFYVTLDYRHDCSEIFKTTARLYKMGIKPIPVYHGDGTIDWLRRYHDLGHKLVGIGITAHNFRGSRIKLGQYYDRVFNFGEKVGMKFHGFRQTGKYMFAFPWWSVDSTSWIRAAAVGEIIIESKDKGGRVYGNRVVVSVVRGTQRYSTKVLASLRELVEDRGWDLKELMSSQNARALYNIESMQRMSNTGVQTQRWQPLF